MMLRTPPPEKKRRTETTTSVERTPVSDRRLVIYNDHLPISAQDPSSSVEDDHSDMVCTYQCRQMVKSELMDAFSSAEKQVLDYQSKVEALSNGLHNSENERQKCYDQLLLLEQELAASRGREHALQERLLKEVNDSHNKYQLQAKNSSELEVQLKKEAELRRNAETVALAAKDRAADAENKLEHFSESAEREKMHLLRELSESQSEAKLSCSRLNIELEQMKLKADCTMEESELLKKQMEDLKKQLNECLLQKNELSHQLKDLVAASHGVAPSEDRSLLKHLQEELRNYEADVQEARKLKSSHSDVELLKEKLLDEKMRRESAEVELLRLQEVELRSIELADELMALKSVIKEIPGVSSFEELPNKFAALQKETLFSMKKIGDTTERLTQLEVALELATIGKQQAETESMLTRKQVDELISEENQLKKMLKAVTEDRDQLRKDPGITKQKTGEFEGGIADKSLIQVTSMQRLESSLIERETFIRELESNLQEQREIINNKHDELRLVNEKLSYEAKRVKSLEREGDRLRSEIALLESKIGHGDYSASNTKVLRMVNTLSVDNEAKHTIETLRTELQKAQAKLQAVEELKGQSDAGNLIDSNISEKLAQLKGQIATLEKREERYKTVFADKISVFRRACCSLFGYKIIMDEQQRPDGIPITRFTLQSIYAQDEDEKLEFEYESGNINILVNKYTTQRDISHQVEIFVRKMNSIPAFTANLTIESFNKRTLS